MIFSLKIIIYCIKRFFIRTYDENILVRGACLTNDSLKILFPNIFIKNYQKSRVDVLNLKYSNCGYRPILFDVRFIDKNLYNLYIDQIPNFWEDVKKKNFLIIDSYSELTDQLFVNNINKNKIFNVNYTDVNKKCNLKYSCHGLINNNDVKKNYSVFFSNLRIVNKHIKIIYIFFPIVYELRQKFIDQHLIIYNAIHKMKNKHKISIINVPSKLLSFQRIDDFPYHYNNEVYSYVANQIKLKLI